MRFPAFPSRATLIACVLGVGAALASTPALAVGEEITDVRVLGNQRTEESTVRSVAGVSIGDTLETDTLDMVRERLNTTGLFSDVNVWWEQYKTGVRVNIAVKDKFPWAPVPTGSWSANNKSFGLLFVHGNLFGRGKQLLIGGRIATVDSGAALAYRDPSWFGSWIYWQLQGNLQRQNIPEYFPADSGADAGPYRATLLTSYGIEPAVGVAWFRRVKTQVAWRVERFNVDKSYDPNDPTQAPLPLDQQATLGSTVGIGKASVSFDFRAREFAVMTGTALGGSFDYAQPAFKSDLTFWRAGGGVEHGIRIFKSHNLITSVGATFGKNLPFWMENSAGGPNLRGYLFQQFRGDSQLAAHAEYHFPLFSISALDFRALAFYDIQAIWFRDLPPAGIGQYATRDTPDRRTFLVDNNGYPPDQPNFVARRDVHQAVGGGLRFFLRSVAVPLIGFDAGYGLESKAWRFTLIIGA
jgi:outer membrane protein insertion porin family